MTAGEIERIMQTLKQFEQAWMDDYLAENPEVSKADYIESTPAGSRAELWRKYLTEKAQAGESFPLDVCRDIAKRFGPNALPLFAKNYPNSVPANVLFVSGKLA